MAFGSGHSTSVESPIPRLTAFIYDPLALVPARFPMTDRVSCSHTVSPFISPSLPLIRSMGLLTFHSNVDAKFSSS